MSVCWYLILSLALISDCTRVVKQALGLVCACASWWLILVLDQGCLVRHLSCTSPDHEDPCEATTVLGWCRRWLWAMLYPLSVLDLKLQMCRKSKVSSRVFYIRSTHLCCVYENSNGKEHFLKHSGRLPGSLMIKQLPHSSCVGNF